MTRTIFIVFAQLGFSHNTTEQFRHTAFFAAAAKCSFLRTLRVMLARTVISASCFAVHRKEKNLARKSTAPQLKIIPLGGLGEIGKNMTVLEYNEDIIVIDCGLAFPDEEMPGIDMVIPDMSYLEQNAERLRAFIITHGHEDHIGAISYALEKFKVPVFGTKFTLALIEHKLHEHHVEDTCLECINAGDVIEIGCFKIEFIKVSHSIAGAVALAVTTPVGIIVHTGDFKVDYTPIDNEPIDINSFARYGTKGVLALLMDSTNAELSGVTPSEKELGKTFEKVFTEAEGRIIVASFASNVYRIQQVVDTAVRHNRVICFQGRSMVMITKIAKDLGYLELPEDSVVELEKLKNYENNRVCVLTTGSQGESMSGLFRMANANHKLIIGKGDTVITFVISSKKVYEHELEKNEYLSKKIQEHGIATKKPVKKNILNSKMESDRLLNVYKNQLVLATKLLQDYPNNLILGGALTIEYDNAIYLIVDGYDKKYKNLCCNYLIRWYIINEGVKKQYKYFNMNCISGEFRKKNPYSGLNENKIGFDGIPTEYIGEFDLILNNFNYKLYRSFSTEKNYKLKNMNN